MTREKASKVLEMFLYKQCDLERTKFAYDANTVWDAVKMASEALEQEPVLDKIRAEIEKLQTYVLCKGDTKKIELSDMLKILDKYKAESKGVLEQTEWIPVDYDRYPETYPKAFQEVWITDGYGEVYHKAYDGTRSIKAWMPYIIPKPYKAESEGKE